MVINVLKILIIQDNFYSNSQFIPLRENWAPMWQNLHHQHDIHPKINEGKEKKIMKVYKFTYFPKATGKETKQPSLTSSSLPTASPTKGHFLMS